LDGLAPSRIIVGVTGSSAPQLGLAMLQVLERRDDVEVHLVLSKGARKSIRAEMDVGPEVFEKLADVVHEPDDMAASISSGSFITRGMAIIPCSMHTLGEVASGVSAALVSRAADVCLKERRPLVLVTRETPLNLIHLRNMETVTLAGATVLPPVPAFYHKPASIDDLLMQTVGKVLDQFRLGHELFRRWDGAADD
jgi:polyprenyl P-hydroxybenzoate/phenylacrylic acid decarboxylase-like protein